MPASLTLATIAEYFRLGIEIGLLEPESARAWANSEIARLDAPPYEIIEVSWSKDLSSLLDALSSVPGERDRQSAGRWLLGLLRERLPRPESELQHAASQAMRIAQAAELGDDEYYRFDAVDDELSLARNNVYGSVEECRSTFLAELAAYPVAPFGSDA